MSLIVIIKLSGRLTERQEQDCKGHGAGVMLKIATLISTTAILAGLLVVNPSSLSSTVVTRPGVVAMLPPTAPLVVADVGSSANLPSAGLPNAGLPDLSLPDSGLPALSIPAVSVPSIGAPPRPAAAASMMAHADIHRSPRLSSRVTGTTRRHRTIG